jgi:hypothetical protein
MKLNISDVFCFDTSAFITMKNYYPLNTFVTLWTNLENMISQKTVVSPQEVFIELEKIDDELLGWVRKNSEVFHELDQEQISFATEIIRDFPKLIDPNKDTSEADPFVIALAKKESAIVVTQESLSRQNKIPDVCRQKNIQCIPLLQFFNMQNWKF